MHLLFVPPSRLRAIMMTVSAPQTREWKVAASLASGRQVEGEQQAGYLCGARRAGDGRDRWV